MQSTGICDRTQNYPIDILYEVIGLLMERT
jgi:hypothetical protein